MQPWFNKGNVKTLWIFGGLGAIWLIAQIASPIVWPKVNYSFSGFTNRNLIDWHEFHVRISHQHPGGIQQGTVLVSIRGPAVVNPNLSNNDRAEEWTFSNWQPNDENAKEFVFPVSKYGTELELEVLVRVKAAGVADYTQTLYWYAYRWVDAPRGT